MVKSSIFKSYDIRGIYPDQLNEHTAFQVGRGFVAHTGVKIVAVGHDARLSSPELFRALTEGIVSQGANVWSLGQVPTEMLYFAVGTLPVEGGVMITASHNPKEYNGFKMMRKVKGDIEWIRGKDMFSVIEQNGFEERPHGSITEKDVWPDFIKHLNSFIAQETIRPFKVVVDASNGVIGKAIDLLMSRLPIELFRVNFNPDGNFPNHSPNPLESGASAQIAGRIKAEGADFGVMFDGDADRIFLIDEQGNMTNPDVLRLLLAKHFLQQEPGAAIVHDLICSKAVPEFIRQWGGKPIRSKVGFVNIREQLIEHKGVVGGEMTGHYCFRDTFYADSGMVAFLTLLQVLSSDGRKVSEIQKELMKYHKADQLNFSVDDKEGMLEKFKEAYADGAQDFLDGVTVKYQDWWFNARPSNTEPLLRLTIEADTAELLAQKKQELENLINKG